MYHWLVVRICIAFASELGFLIEATAALLLAEDGWFPLVAPLSFSSGDKIAREEVNCSWKQGRFEAIHCFLFSIEVDTANEDRVLVLFCFLVDAVVYHFADAIFFAMLAFRKCGWSHRPQQQQQSVLLLLPLNQSCSSEGPCLNFILYAGKMMV